MDILFPKNNESDLELEIHTKKIQDWVFAYSDFSKPTVVLDDIAIKKIGLNKILRSSKKIIYCAKYSSNYISSLIKKDLLLAIYGLEWHNRKNLLRKIDSGISAENLVLLKKVKYGFCASDILEELQNNSNKILPRLRQNARLLKNTFIFSGIRPFSESEKHFLCDQFFK